MNIKEMKIILAVLLMFLCFPFEVLGQGNEGAQGAAATDEVFEARVVRILEQKKMERKNGLKVVQQNLLLRGLEGRWNGKEIRFNGISDIEVASGAVYREGDRVLVQKTAMFGREDVFYVVDFVRRNQLYLLTAIFIAVVIMIGGKRGVRALFSLLISFVVVLKFILPRIVSGGNPLLVTLLGSFAILVTIIYLTEGWKTKSHLAIVSVAFSLVVTLFLSVVFTGFTRLTGLAQEEVIYLMSIGKQAIDFKGLLLAGIMIGAVGVLDDIVVSQIETVEQLKEANPELSNKRIFKMAYRVGNAHLGAIVNTLFLTYAGASLPLLLLFVIKQEPFLTFGQIINNEMVATEIVRTLVGSIGIALSMPIATFVGAYWLKLKNGGDLVE